MTRSQTDGFEGLGLEILVKENEQGFVWIFVIVAYFFLTVL